MHPAYSVIVFTTSSGAGYGLILLMALYGLTGGIPVDPWLGGVGLGIGTVLVTGGLLASTFHLGHPERAWRAYSQWRSSWLSREGLLATAAYIPLVLTAWNWIINGSLEGPFSVFTMALIILCVLTVHATGMIYATLRTIPAWHQRLTVPGYLVFALLTGAIWFQAIAGLFSVRSPEISLVVVIALFLAWYVKRAYWRRIDAAPGRWRPADAIGLPDHGTVRLLDPPHTHQNFVQKEMGYRVARKHARKLRRISFIAFFLVPLVLTAVSAEAESLVAIPATLLAAVSVTFGTVVERWLFFAEARHLSMLYYGADSA